MQALDLNYNKSSLNILGKQRSEAPAERASILLNTFMTWIPVRAKCEICISDGIRNGPPKTTSSMELALDSS